MNLLSILSDNTPPPGPQTNQSPMTSTNPPTTISENPKAVNNSFHNDSTSALNHHVSQDDHKDPMKMLDHAHLHRFENKVNLVNRLDEILSNNASAHVLATEKSHLRTIMDASELIASNYVDRIATEHLISTDSTPNIPSSPWGSTRLRPSDQAIAARREALQDAAAAYITSEAATAATSASTSPGASLINNIDALDEELSSASKSKTRKRSSHDASAEKKRKLEDQKDQTPAEKSSRARNAKENGRLRIKLSLKDSQGSHNNDTASAEGSLDADSKEDASKLSPQKSKELKSVAKQYDNTFVSIWKDLSRKDGPKVARLLQQSNQAKLINLKKTAILASREAKRWQLKNNKNQKDLTSKARRAMREMFNFWKRTDRIEREQRKKQERELIDKAKKEEEEREAKRQSRKLDFLITQTELYSHFIGKKIKTDEIEGGDADPNLHKNDNHHLDKYHGATHDGTPLDFDNDDQDALHRAAAANAQSAVDVARSRAQAFDDDPLRNPDTNGEEMNFQNPTLIGDMTVTQPDMLKCTLKEYQIKGLNWLANLYEQGINGILADEMGLGKTVQSISVLAYLAEAHNIWGPFLVVTPASTLHNWQQEITKFVPDFKVLPYWGSAKDRKVLRKFWDRKSLRYDRDAPFHVLVTSYQLVVADAAYFQKMKWQYMILDEAQAIKSSQSSRWKSLLSFSCRNRLLLTGTPIQNSMQELWALLHFIMPSLFDSHDEFSDWFSKDIESHAQSNTQLNEQQLKRLHVILKPFMLRRVKKNVQSELGDKVEVDLFCDLTNRQKKYYQMLKSQISIIDLLDNSSTNDDAQSLMNLVMQFRKVCNHPDLFERADVKSSLAFGTFAETSSFLRETNLELYYTFRNLIHYRMPKLLFNDLLRPGENNQVGSKQKIYNMFSIYNPDNIQDDKYDNFGWMKFCDVSANELKTAAGKDVLQRAIDIKSYKTSNYDGCSRLRYAYDEDVEEALPLNKMLLLLELNNRSPDISGSIHLKELHSIKNKAYEDMYINVLEPTAEPAVAAVPIDLDCSDISLQRKYTELLFDEQIRASLTPMPLNKELELLQRQVPVPQYPKSNMMPEPLNKLIDYSNIRMPSMNRFITESGKLSKLDQLLDNLKQNDHRVLIYFQMTKMMDLMEEYLTFRQHNYIRLDGSSKLEDRRDLVHDWQTKPEIFVFLLSTRAGGLGINLTAADTVIFYDSDWNPTIDSQAMDRAHRLGQTKQVTVYRLLTKNTIEQRMRDRAKQKEQVQQVVMEGKATSFAKKKEDATNKKKDLANLLLGGEDNDEQYHQEPAAENQDGEAANGNLNTASDNTESSTPAPERITKDLEALYHEGEGRFSGTITPSM